MPSFADMFYNDHNLSPIESMSTALMFLATLFEAKISGVVETRSMPLLRALATRPTTSIDDDIKEFMDLIRGRPIFLALSDTHGAFIREWRGLETMFGNWMAQQESAVQEQLRDLENAFMSEQGSLTLHP
jgi:hypothetical protein